MKQINLSRGHTFIFYIMRSYLWFRRSVNWENPLHFSTGNVLFCESYNAHLFAHKDPDGICRIFIKNTPLN